MRTTFAILAFLYISPPLEAQQPEAGFLKVVNLVSLRTPTFIRLGNFEFDDGNPIPAGGDSGTLALKPDSYTISVSNEGTDLASNSVDFEIENGRNVIVMCYDEAMEKKDGSLSSRLRFNVLSESTPSEKPRISVVSLLRKSSVSIQIGAENVLLSDRQAHRIDPEIGDSFKIRFNGNLVGEIEVSEPTHYIVFLYRDPKTDDVAMSLLMNEKLEYHPPLEDDERKDDSSENPELETQAN